MSVTPFQPQQAWVDLLEPTAALAREISNTEFVPAGLRGNPAAIAACILYGAELGLPPMMALNRIAVIDGRPSLSAEAMRALILAAGHLVWVEESTITRVTLAGQRRGSDQTTRVTWTMDDAKRAGLAGKPGWQRYPRQYLLARASAELARSVFADVVGGLAAQEEIEDADFLEERAPKREPAEGAPARRQRKRAVAAVPAAPEPQAEPEPAPALPPLPGEDDAPPLPEAAPTEEHEGEEPGPEVGGEPPMLVESQRRFLHVRKRELGLSDEELRGIIQDLTGQPSTRAIPRDRLDELLAAMEAAHVQAQLDVGPPPHADRG